MSLPPLRSVGTLAAVLAATLGTGASAVASSWGSIPGGAGDDELTCLASCTFAQTRYANQTLHEATGGNAVVVTGWRLDGAGGRARLRVVGGPGASAWVALPSSVTHPAQLSVSPGQYVGVDLADGARVPFYSSGWVTDAYLARTWEPALPDGAGSTSEDPDLMGYAGLEVDVEPDVDGDGLGDDTQDPDGGRPPKDDGGGGGTPQPTPEHPVPPKQPTTPTVPRTPLAPQGPTLPAAKKPGPAVPKSGPKVKLPTTASATKKGVVTVTLTNPYGQPLKGRITARLGRRTAGSAAVKLAADTQKQVTLKLSKAARATLKRKRRVSIEIAVKLTGPKGRARTTRTTTVAKLGKAAAPGQQQPGTPAPPAAQQPGTQTPPADDKAPGFDGTYRAPDGQVMVVENGRVLSFTGTITTYCTGSGKQKNVEYLMMGNDPDPTIAPDGSFSWEATSGYGFVKLKFDGRITGSTASGKLMVEDRSFKENAERLEFDYCFAGKDWTLSK